MNIFGIVRNAAALIADQFADKDLRQPNLTLRGNIAVEQILATAGGSTPTTAETDDGSIAAGQLSQLTITENYIFDAINGAAWVRNQALLSNLDAQIETGLAFQGNVSRLQAFNGATFDRLRSQGSNVDAIPTLTLGLLASNNYPKLFNGATFDRQRGNFEETILVSAVRNANTNSADFTNHNGGDLVVFLNITAVTAAQTVQLFVDGRDPVSGGYLALGQLAATGAVGIVGGNLAVIFTLSSMLPRTWRVRIVHSGAGNFTYSVGASIKAA